jgi:hypothetical protein
MADIEIGAFSVQDAQQIMDAVRWLRQSGFQLQANNRRRANSIDAAIHVVKNESGESIIPYACMQVIGTERLGNRTYHLVDKPADTDGTSGWYLFNGHHAITEGSLGNGLDGPLVRARCQDTAFDAGDQFQPIVDSWYVEKVAGVGPFIGAGADTLNNYEDCIKLFVIGGGGKGGGQQMIFTIDDVYGVETAASEHCDDQLKDAKDRYLASCLYRQCGSGVPAGANEDGKYEVVDYFGFITGREEADVVGKMGLATYMEPCDGYGECEWVITWIDWFRIVTVLTGVRMTDTELCFDRKNVEVWDDCELDPVCIPLTDCESY